MPQQLYDAEIPQFGLVIAALSGTAQVANGSTAVTFSAAQTLNAGSILYFASQPGIPYVVAATTAASTSATLTTAYTGQNAAATSVNSTAALAGTVSVTNGSRSITFSQNQTLNAGTILYFSSQPGVAYALSAAIAGATAGTLTASYRGTTNASATTLAVNALTGTVTVTNASTAITFSLAQTLTEGTMLIFSAQPGVSYSLAASISAATAAVLTSPFTGATSSTGFTTVGSSDYLPTRGGAGEGQPNGGCARAIQCDVAGTLICDCFGVGGGVQGTGNMWVSIPMIAGQQMQLMVTRIHMVGTTGQYVALF